eukprot:6074308-Pyramimonas_sp.AAC.1
MQSACGLPGTESPDVRARKEIRRQHHQAVGIGALAIAGGRKTREQTSPLPIRAPLPIRLNPRWGMWQGRGALICGCLGPPIVHL